MPTNSRQNSPEKRSILHSNVNVNFSGPNMHFHPHNVNPGSSITKEINIGDTTGVSSDTFAFLVNPVG